MMPGLASIPPACRTDLVLRPLEDQQRFVAKDPRSGAYFELGEQEYFLLTQLDGEQSAEAVCARFASKFNEPLELGDLDEFVDLACKRGLIQSGAPAPAKPVPMRSDVAAKSTARSSHKPTPRPPAAVRQSILCWRKSLFDPDRLFTRLEPKLRFLWTRTFVVFSAGSILLAFLVTWHGRQHLVHSLPHALNAQTLLLGWLTLLLITTCHEFAHGLTCKHYGGEVHEVGFLLLFFMPCFYCNVSDAWLLREKSKRLWVTLAGGYSDLCLWAAAVFAWRLTLPGTLPHYLAWVVLSICGAQICFNFNPLLKLDGYYLLSDWAGIPNLRQRAWVLVAGHLRWLLWGAARPAREPRLGFLLIYGILSWSFSLLFLLLLLLGLARLLGSYWGILGGGLGVLLAMLLFRGMFDGIATREAIQMILMRRKRTLVWLGLLGVLPAILYFGQIEERSGGPFQARAAIRAEVRAPLSAFLQEAGVEEGDRVSAQAPVARLEIPDLASRLAQKRAELHEAQAKLRLMEIGPRPEEVAAQRGRVKRAYDWRDLAERDLQRTRKALEEDLRRLDEQILQHRAEQDFAHAVLARSRRLESQKVQSEEQLQEAQKQLRVCRSLEQQAEAQKRIRQAVGTQEAEVELARREKDLGDARALLTILEAGSRPEEVEAARAHVVRLSEEIRYLEQQTQKLAVNSPVAGVVKTPRLREKIGQYFREGDPICEIEDLETLEVEIVLEEQEVTGVQPGQRVELKARALPFQTFQATVDRIAPSAAKAEVQSTVTVYCRLKEPVSDLRPMMTGYARIYRGQRSLGGFLVDRAVRFLRTEFWW
jgi:putative peptide zinc metalloprotease protein